MARLNISPADLEFVGENLQRPETVLATRSGDIFMPDKRGGVSVVRADGTTVLIRARNAPAGFLPNGFALLPDRSFLIADLGIGGVWHMSADGELTPRLMEVDGRRLEPTNFVGIDRNGRTWVSVSTRLVPREQAMRKDYADGYIILVDERGARIVAEGIGFTNEVIVDPAGDWLYVNETMARCTSRFAIRRDGSLGPREVFAQYGPGTWPDGFAFDAQGGVWCVSVVSNRVIRIAPDRSQHVVLEDADPDQLRNSEQAFEGGTFTRRHLDSGGRRSLGNLSGIGFGGPDLKTVFLGSLFGSRIATFRSPVAGAEPVQWNF